VNKSEVIELMLVVEYVDVTSIFRFAVNKILLMIETAPVDKSILISDPE
jgi:hypothetical protein